MDAANQPESRTFRIRPANADPNPPEPGGDRVLRAKYYDWCSARIAERFVQLSVERIYELAGAAADNTRELSFAEVVDRATEALAAEMSLPSFESWLAAYRAEPERYEEDLAGFWRDES